MTAPGPAIGALPPASRPHGDVDPFVFHARPLRPGCLLADTPRYSQDVWALAPAELKKHERRQVLDFTRVPQQYQQAAKELCYAMLSGTVPPGEDRPAVGSVRTFFTDYVRFLRWVDARRAGLGAVTAQDLEDYQRHLIACLPGSSARATARVAARKFWLWRHVLTCGGLRCDPVNVDGWGEPMTRRASENSTARVPEEVLGPLFAWAIRFVDEFSPDILAADRHWRDRRTDVAQAHGDLPARLQALLDEHLAEARPLPGWRGKPSTIALARILGRTPSSLASHRTAIEQTAAIVGVVPETIAAGPIRGRLDGRPWLPAIAADYLEPDSLAALARHLHTACYIVISFLSGARDSEIKHLTRGAVTIERDTHGRAYRWKMRSLAFKTETDPAGVPALWGIGEPASRAVAVLEHLQPPGTDLLFTPLRHSPGHKVDAASDVLTSGTTNLHLNDFTSWVNGYCRRHARPDTITGTDGRPPRLRNSQFRRTLAWFIARRPGGVIAGALAYRHHGVQVFEGYAGTSDSGFRAEVESEQALARGEYLMAAIDGHEHLDLTGPAAQEAARRLQTLADDQRFTGRVVLDGHRLRRLMARHDPGIYPGEYVSCVHDRTKALCERAVHAPGEGLPDHGGCKPLTCSNVALTPKNVLAWQRELDRVTARLASPSPLPPLLRHRLRTRHEEITTFLDTRTTPNGPS